MSGEFSGKIGLPAKSIGQFNYTDKGMQKTGLIEGFRQRVKLHFAKPKDMPEAPKIDKNVLLSKARTVPTNGKVIIGTGRKPARTSATQTGAKGDTETKGTEGKSGEVRPNGVESSKVQGDEGKSPETKTEVKNEQSRSQTFMETMPEKLKELSEKVKNSVNKVAAHLDKKTPSTDTKANKRRGMANHLTPRPRWENASSF